MISYLCTYFADFSLVVLSCHGQENKEGWDHGEVWDPLRRQLEEDRQEDGDLAAQQVPVHLLREGQDEETGIVKLGQGSGKNRQGMAVKAK